MDVFINNLISVLFLSTYVHSCTQFVNQKIPSCLLDQYSQIHHSRSSSPILCATLCDTMNKCGLLTFNKSILECRFYSAESKLWKCTGVATVEVYMTETELERHKNMPTPRDCEIIKQNFPTSKNGIYLIQPVSNDSRSQMTVLCDMNTNNRQWIVVQKRFDNSVDFNRTWTEFKNGFGSLSSEFWLGNEKLHLLTNRGAGATKVRFDLWAVNDSYAYAEYEAFSVGGEGDQYRLKIGGYSGTAGDAMFYMYSNWYLNNAQFSTYDRDNDRSDNSCSKSNNGFWYNNCGVVRINADINTGSNKYFWGSWENSDQMTRSEMKVSFL